MREAIGLFLCIPALAFLGRRFWCRNLCPSGALSSLASRLRLLERRGKPYCIRCGLCERRWGAAWAKQQRRLNATAIVVLPENVDRPA